MGSGQQWESRNNIPSSRYSPQCSQKQLKMKSRLVGTQKINSAEATPVVNTTSQMEDHSQMKQGEEDDLDTTVPVDKPHNASHPPTDVDNTIDLLAF